MKKSVVAAISTLLLLSGCSNKEEASTKEETKEVKQEELNIIENQELTNKLNNETAVKVGKVYEQDGVVFVNFEVNEKASIKDAEVLVKKYAETLKSEFVDLEVRVNAEKNGKKVANITMNKEENVKNESIIKNGETVNVKQLVEEGVITFKMNPVSQQLSLLLDSTKLTGILEGKKDSELVLLVGIETFDLKSNIFKPTQFDVANTDFSETELKAAKIVVK